MRIEILADVKTTLGEGPLWDVDEQRLYWIDSFDGRVFRCTADGRELRAWDVPQKIGSMALRKQAGGGVAGARFSLPGFSQRRGRADRRSRARQARQPAERRQGRPAGALLRRQHGHAGSRTQRRPLPAGSDLSLHRLDTGIVVSNGPCWSPDGRTFYFADTWSGEIWAYDCDPASGAIRTAAPSRAWT